MARRIIRTTLVVVGTAYSSTPLCDSNQFDWPIVIGHRGGAGSKFRQSSLKGYEHIVKHNGANYLECDLTVTADHVLICSHEPEILSATDITTLNSKLRRSILSNDRLTNEELDPLIDWTKTNNSHDQIKPSLLPNVRRATSWYLTDLNWTGQVEHMSAPCPYNNSRTTSIPLNADNIDSLPQLCPHIEPQRLATLEELWSLVNYRNTNNLTIHHQSRYPVKQFLSQNSTTPAQTYSNTARPPLMGLYLEIKHQTWHKSRRNLDLLNSLFIFLQERAIADSDPLRLPFPVYIQSFELSDLIRLRQMIGGSIEDKRRHGSNICLVGLGGAMRDLFKLPRNCCGKLTAASTTGAYSSALSDRSDRSVAEMSLAVELNDNNIIGSGRALRLITLKRSINDSLTEPAGWRRSDICSGPTLHDSLSGPKITAADLFHSVTADLAQDGLNPVIDPGCYMDAIGLHLEFVQNNPHVIEELSIGGIANGIPVHLWTVRSQQSLENALSLGASGVITDFAIRDKLFIEKSWTATGRMAAI